MEKKFTSDEVPMGQLLDEARAGELQLPDFQRGWVWDDDHISSLLASISMSYPIGAVMTLQTGNPDVRFRPHPLQGVELGAPVEPEILLLDGQQRMTSLYLALKSDKPVPTTDAKGHAIERWYYADIMGCLDPFIDREEAVFGVPADRVVKKFGNERGLDLSARDLELAERMFPLSIVLDSTQVMSWMLAFLHDGPGDSDERLDVWGRFNEAVVTAFVQYQVPTIQLVKSTPKEAVCQVFEKVNTGGVALSVFELLTATYSADDFRLRDDWEARAKRLHLHPVLARFAATDFLQTVTLLATYQRRCDHIANNPGDERIPPVSCKRKDVLRLSLADYQKWADVATDALEGVVPLLHGEHIFEARDLPYATQIAPMASIFAVLGDKAEGHAVRQQIRRWYWCGVFGEMYGGSTETRLANDLQDVFAWITEEGEEPRTIKESQFQADRLLTLKSRLSAAYKGLFALQMKRGCRDFRTGNPIDVHAYFDDAIDIHHIFPQKWCVDHGIGLDIGDTVVNKTAIDSKTNKIIGGRAPSDYLERIEKKEGVEPAELDSLLQSHDIDPVTMREDDFPSFFNRRFERLLKQIEEATGKPVNRNPAKNESPFTDPEKQAAQLEESVRALMAAEESKVVEFKSTGRHSLRTGDKDDAVEWAIVKTLSGFMNANGGTLLVGVNDVGQAVGIEQDYPHLRKQDRDGWELWVTDLVSTTMGKLTASELSVAICEVDGHDVARIEVGPSPSEVFARPAKGEKHEHFYARINNRTEELTGQVLLDYQRRRWPL